MDYFLLKQDPRYTDVPVLENITDKVDLWNLSQLEPAHLGSRPLMLKMKSGKNSTFLDLLESALPLMSERLMRMLQAYGRDTVFKPVALIDMEQQVMKNYVVPFLPYVDALHSSSEWNLDQTVLRQIVLQEEAVRDYPIFRIQEGRQQRLIVRLDVAESMLRRDFTGLTLTPLQVESLEA